MELFLFAAFASVATLGAVGVIALRNPVHSVLSLAMVFVALAGLYVFLSAPFIAAAQVMIYAGAILILFLFVIMLLSPEIESGVGALPMQKSVAILFGLLLVVELVFAAATAIVPIGSGQYTPERIAQIGDTEAVGALLFTDFLLPFEITSLLLLVAIVGVIVLTKRPKTDDGRQIANRE
jgi:NADH-quinone oxidoreductase subunit J